MKLSSLLIAASMTASSAIMLADQPALDQEVFFRCMEDHQSLQPALRGEACSCVAQRATRLLYRLQHALIPSRLADRADANECIAAAVGRMASALKSARP